MHPSPAAAGWHVQASPHEPHVDLLDPAGRSRARVLGLSREHPEPAGREVLTVLLPDGTTTTLRNGSRWWGTRRARTRGVLPLAGSTYVLEHRTADRARVLRDGVWIATARTSLRGLVVEVAGPPSGADELATALLVHVLRPGRDSVPEWLLDVFGSG